MLVFFTAPFQLLFLSVLSLEDTPYDHSLPVSSDLHPQPWLLLVSASCLLLPTEHLHLKFPNSTHTEVNQLSSILFPQLTLSNPEIWKSYKAPPFTSSSPTTLLPLQSFTINKFKSYMFLESISLLWISTIILHFRPLSFLIMSATVSQLFPSLRLLTTSDENH